MTGDGKEIERVECIFHKRIALGKIGGALGLERGREPVHVLGTSIGVKGCVACAPNHLVQ